MTTRAPEFPSGAAMLCANGEKVKMATDIQTSRDTVEPVTVSVGPFLAADEAVAKRSNAMRKVNVTYLDPSQPVDIPIEPVWTAGQAAAMLGMTTRALSKYLARHPDLAEPRYGRGPSRRWERLLTTDEVVRIQKSRFRRAFPPAEAKRQRQATTRCPDKGGESR